MAVKVKLCLFLVELTKCSPENEVEGRTVGECIENLIREFPKLKGEIIDPEGNLLYYLNIYVNGASTHPETLVWPVRDGDEIQIVLPLSGG